MVGFLTCATVAGVGVDADGASAVLMKGAIGAVAGVGVGTSHAVEGRVTEDSVGIDGVVAKFGDNGVEGVGVVCAGHDVLGEEVKACEEGL